MMHSQENSGGHLYVGIVLVILSKLILQILFYYSGFEALTADEFSRTALAASWAQHPTGRWSGVWLPFHIYLLGIALRFWWDLLWVPRIITLILGSISIILMYQFAKELFGKASIALVGAILLALNPVHFWLSGTALAEIPQVTLILAAMLTFVRYLKAENKRYVYASAALLAVATGFRYESWMISIVFSLILAGKAIFQFRNGKIDLREVIVLLIAAGIPWIFPMIWIVGNYHKTGNPLYFLTLVKSYNLTWYGEGTSYGNYIKTLLKLDPFATIGALVGLAICLRRLPRSGPVRWYTCIALVPFLGFIYLQGGQPDTEANLDRYLALFLFLTYPAVAYLLWGLVTSLKMPGVAPGWPLTLVLGVISVWQLHTAFRLPHNTDADGLQVGQRIQDLRREDPNVAQQPVLLERIYWQFLAINIGTNDVSTLLYDRPQELPAPTAKSVFLADKHPLVDCVSQYHFSFIVVKSPDLRQAVEDKLGLAPVGETAGYTFYKVPARQTNMDGIPPEACHLNITLAQ
ncbi:MAG: phospholipid carrier-dependent glycosyltransferase [Chloroflexi bacterium]|nr:phospholipid carrier-dependent glycosyltransferase [Chloroflexota bacterium]